jgi:hypothetical protein
MGWRYNSASFLCLRRHGMRWPLPFNVGYIDRSKEQVNPLNAELKPIRHLLALAGVHHSAHVSRIRVKWNLIMSFDSIITQQINMSYFIYKHMNLPSSKNICVADWCGWIRGGKCRNSLPIRNSRNQVFGRCDALSLASILWSFGGWSALIFRINQSKNKYIL